MIASAQLGNSEDEVHATYLDPLLFLLREHGVSDHLRLDRDIGEPLEAEPDVAVELALRL